MATKKQRYTITVDDEIFKAIEDFRFANRYNTKSEATSALIEIGLKQMMRDLEKDSKDSEQ